MNQQRRAAWPVTACIACAASFLVSCSQPPRPDLGRLYAMQAHPDRPPVILIHGMLGSRLIRPDGREAWPGSAWRLLFDDYDSLAFDIDPETLEPRAGNLVVGGITDRAAGRDFYASIIRVLQQAGGYELAEVGKPPPARNSLYVFTYDWRRDNVATARALDAFIERVRADHADPALKVDVIAHSMGGLIARYYLRYGTADVLDDNEFPVNNHGAGRIRRMILLGTPNLGSAKAIRSFLEGYDIGFGSLPPEVVATFPSAYQLLPHSIVPWIVTAEGRELTRDLFDVEIWRRFEFSMFAPDVEARVRDRYADEAEGTAAVDTLRRYAHKRLERARRFVWSLTVPQPEAPVRHVVFGGDCHLTPARIVVEEVDGESVVRLWPREITAPLPGVDYEALMLEPGDGVVTKSSLLARHALDPTIARHRYSFFPMQFAFFLCEAHDALTTNIYFQDNLLHALLSADELSP
jgi:pimeloyl-ACP methyl ester carboxylesterase